MPNKTKAPELVKPDHISVSQIQTGECLYKYKVMRLLKDLPGGIEESNDAMLAGRFVHAVIHRYTDHCLKAKVDQDFEIMSSIIEAIAKEEKVGEEIIEQNRPALMDFGEKGIEQDIILKPEEEFRIEFSPGRFVEGYIDRTNSYESEVGTVLDVIDYKNSRNIPTASQVAENRQLRVYTWVAANHLHPGYQAIRRGIYCVPFNYVRWAGDPVPVMELSKEFEATEKMLDRQWERLHETEEYPPEQGAACWRYDGCPVLLAGECPAYGKREMAAMQKSDKVEALVRALRKMDIEKKATTKKLKAIFETRAPQDVDDKPVGFQEVKSTTYILSKIQQWAAASKTEIGGIKITESELKKAIKITAPQKDIYEGILKDIKFMGIESQSTRFKY